MASFPIQNRFWHPFLSLPQSESKHTVSQNSDLHSVDTGLGVNPIYSTKIGQGLYSVENDLFEEKKAVPSTVSIFGTNRENAESPVPVIFR